MPVLTADEGKLLMELAHPAVKTIGRNRLLELLALTDKLHSGVQVAEQEKAEADFLLHSFWLVASGVLTEADILAHPRLGAEHRADLLAVLQLRFDAEAWRGCTDYVPSTALPAVTPVNPFIEPARV